MTLRRLGYIDCLRVYSSRAWCDFNYGESKEAESEIRTRLLADKHKYEFSGFDHV